MAFEDLRIEMKCKDFRIEVEEGLKGESLSIVAQDHAAGCRPCREFNQKHIEFREWLTVCRKVTAPKDFGFGVQRKIAGTSHTHGWAWDRMRYIVPATALAAVMVLMGSLLLFNNRGLTNDQTQAAINAPVSNSFTRPLANNNAPEQKDVLAAVPPSPLESNKQKKDAPVITPKDQPDVDPPGGSSDSAGKRPEESKKPAGINVPKSEAETWSMTLSALRDKGALAGVQDRTVKKVVADSAAARAGIRIGDVVESLNGNTVTITRNGQPLQITLK